MSNSIRYIVANWEKINNEKEFGYNNSIIDGVMCFFISLQSSESKYS